jgi:glycerol kinase
MKRYILSIDAGTTSSRAIIFDDQGNQVALAQHEFTQIFPQKSWVEHDAIEIWKTQLRAINEAIIDANIHANQIASIGITNQRETTVIWDRKTGQPVYNAIVWQDRRTAALCQELTADGHAQTFLDKTGLVLDAYFSGTKVKWILNQDPELRQRALDGTLAFGTIDSWLIWNLTGGRTHVTDVTNASRTLLYNIHDLCWDKELLTILDIPEQLLPQVQESSQIVGHTAADLIGVAIPIAGVAGDQQAALFGQLCLEPGSVKNTYGTGCFCIMNTGDRPVVSKNKMLTTIAWKLDGKVTYALEGSVFTAGALVQWLRDQLHMIEQSADIEYLAASVEDSDGVTFIPALSGLGAPYWAPHTTGTIMGITRGTNKGHIARATLEAITLRSRDIILEMQKDAGVDFKTLKVDGGASNNDLLMQIQADLLGVDVIRPKETETTALGAAFLAGLAVGVWPSTHALKEMWQSDRVFQPKATETAAEVIQLWQERINRIL